MFCAIVGVALKVAMKSAAAACVSKVVILITIQSLLETLENSHRHFSKKLLSRRYQDQPSLLAFSIAQVVVKNMEIIKKVKKISFGFGFTVPQTPVPVTRPRL